MSKPRSRTVTRSRKPTLRVTGQYMYSVTVRFAVGLDDIAWVAAQEFVLRGRTPRADSAKRALWSRLEDRLRIYGPLSCDAWHEISQEQTEQAYEIARTYYPELRTVNR